MDLTPQFILDKFLDFGRALERLSGTVATQDQRLDEIEDEIKDIRAEHKGEIAAEADARRARGSFLVNAVLEIIKGAGGALIGALSTLVVQHLQHPSQHH